ISNVPSGVTFNHGTDDGNGAWSLTQADLTGLTINGVTTDSDADFNLGVTVVLSQNGPALADLTGTIHVTVDAVADLPTLTLTVTDTAVKEDLGQAADQIAPVPSPTAGPQPLTINLSLGANEAATSVTITGVPAGVAFNHGSAGPGNTWVLTPGELSGLQI